MNKITKHSLMAVLAATLGLGATMAQAQTATDRVYVIDTRGEVAKSGFGLCWRTGYWTPAAAANDPAGCACDKDLLPKEKCEPAQPKVADTAPSKTGIVGDKITLVPVLHGSGDFSITLPRGNWTYSLNFQAPLDRPYGGLTIAEYVFSSNTPVYTLRPKQPVAGKVASADGEPVARAEVLISRSLSLRDNQQVIRLYTDELGEFSTTLDQSTGIYDVTVIPIGVGKKGTKAFGRCTRSAVKVSLQRKTRHCKTAWAALSPTARWDQTLMKMNF